MCVVYHFTPGSMIDKESFKNSVYNNWHGYGLILRDAEKNMQVIKECPEGGNDPEKIWKLIEDNQDIDRFLHLRHATKGAVGDLNTQPFSVYNSNKRDVYFMHNGTLPGFGTGWNNPTPTDKSDTLDFCERILAPMLLRFHGKEGKADYTDEFFLKTFLEKYWSQGNRGLFISNDLKPIYFGSDWSAFDKSEENKDKPQVFVSNTLYFKEITRGPFFEKLQQEKREKEQRDRLADGNATEFGRTQGGTTSTTTNVVAYDMDRLSKSAVVLRALGNLFRNGELESVEGCAKLSLVAVEEWDEMIQTENSMYMASLLSRLTDELHDAKVKIQNQDRDIDRMRQRLTDFHLEQKKADAA